MTNLAANEALTDTEVGQIGSEIYQSLRPTIESEYVGKEMAICVETGDYEIADRIAEADRTLRQRLGPEGGGRLFYYQTVGAEPRLVRWATSRWEPSDLADWAIAVASRSQEEVGRGIIGRALRRARLAGDMDGERGALDSLKRFESHFRNPFG